MGVGGWKTVWRCRGRHDPTQQLQVDGVGWPVQQEAEVVLVIAEDRAIINGVGSNVMFWSVGEGLATTSHSPGDWRPTLMEKKVR